MDGTLFLASAMASFKAQKKLAERAVVQLSVEQLHQPLDENTNSMAVIMKHLAGNMLSRWTDFLTTDGEKDWRNRDQEFVDEFRSLEELMDFWRRGWERLFSALEALTAEDLSATVRIRGQAHTVIEAIHRQLDHYGYHVGQMVLTARVLAKDRWSTLSIPPGGSEEYNRRMWKR
jgi:uncharacterized damage-inducible protein DinB